MLQSTTNGSTSTGATTGLQPSTTASPVRRRKQKSPLVAASKQGFNPKLIGSQIIAMQCFHYFVLAVFFQINFLLYGNKITMDRIFTDRYLNLWSVSGWADNFAVFFSAICGSFFLAIIVEKAKKCLDFSVTLFLLHLLACIIYQGGRFPQTWDWWILHIFATIVMILGGEYLCSRKELDEIPLLQI